MSSESTQPSDPSRAPRAFLRVFLALTLGGALLVAGLNFAVNPWGLYPTRLVRSYITNDHTPKRRLLRRLKPPARQLVLGSSRVMRFEPAYLEARTGLPTFNMSVSGCRPLDALVLYRYSTEVARAPIRRVIYGIDTNALHQEDIRYRQLRADSELRTLLPRRTGAGMAADEIPMLFGWQQSGDALVTLSLALGLKRAKKKTSVFARDGLVKRNYLDTARAKPGWSLEEEIREAAEEGRHEARMPEQNPVHWQDLRELLERLRRDRVEAVLFVTTQAPGMRKYWAATGWLEKDRRARSELRAVARDYGARLADFTELGSFDGEPEEFYDAVHPTITNTRKMIGALFPAEEGRRSHAVQ